MLGGPAPFDRHDWVIDRCGKEVRYIIDFYFFDDKAGTPQVRRNGTDTGSRSGRAGAREQTCRLIPQTSKPPLRSAPHMFLHRTCPAAPL